MRIMDVIYVIDFPAVSARLPEWQPGDGGVTGDRFTAAVEDSHLLLAFLTRRSLTMDDRGQNQFRRYVGALARVQTLVAGQRVSQRRLGLADGFLQPLQ